jgi:uncharacterized metal-binding protein
MIPIPTSCGCACQGSGGPKLIFACSGCADVGELADQAARKLDRDGAGRMFCLAGIGGRVSGIMRSTEMAGSILAIDGCPLDCTRKTLDVAGFTCINHLRLSDIGFTKGATEVSTAALAQVVEQAKKYL